MFDLSIRAMIVEDLDAVLEIERMTLLNNWTHEGYKTELERNDSFCLVAVKEKNILGFIVLRLITSAGESEILNFGVLPTFQERGIGTAILKKSLKILLENQVNSLWLEVRQSNLKAQKFYMKNNFKIAGGRKNFYNNPTEDAVLMKLNL